MSAFMENEPLEFFNHFLKNINIYKTIAILSLEKGTSKHLIRSLKNGFLRVAANR